MKCLRKIIVGLLCGIFCITINAQTSKIDSLKQVLASGKMVKAEEALLLLRLSQEYLYLDSAKCRAYAVAAIELAINCGSKITEAKTYSLLGNFYSIFQVPNQALIHHLKAEKIYLELDDKELLYNHYYNMMTTFYDFIEQENVTYYAHKAMSMATERQEWNKALTVQYMLGLSRYRNNYGQEALDYFQNLYHQALHLDDSLKTSLSITNTLAGRCARTYTRGLKLPDKAMPYLHKVLASYLKNGIKPYYIYIYTELAEAHAISHNLDSADYYINRALNSEKTTNYLPQMYLTNAMIDSLKGDYLGALNNYQKFRHITDSMNKESTSVEMARLKVWHEFDQKDLEKRLLQQEYQKQQKLTIVLAILLLLILALLILTIYFYRERIVKNRQMKELHLFKDKLFSIVAHDLRSPVSSLVSLLRMVNMNKLDPEKQSKLLQEISSRVDNTYELVDNLLRWSKSQMQGIVPAPVYFDVKEESGAITDSLQTFAANKMVVFENCIEHQQVFADRDMFAVVVRNLTINAIKYTAAEGKITLSSELSDNMLVISVKDTGIGISPKVQASLFKPSETQSQRGTNNESGTGLGLVLCADFVKANGGRIWFHSVQGEGTTFYFSLPVKG